MTTISQERAGWNAVAGHPPMRRRDQWGARRSYTDPRSVTEPATRVFVHISITNPSAYNSHDAHARALEAIGISRFPNTGVSYNRGFMAGSPNVYELQPMGRRGAHTVNDFKRSTCSTPGCPGRGSSLTAPSWNLNFNARAYVWCANVNNAVPAAVVELIARAIYTDYKAGFITKAAAQNIHGHRCVSAKSCPADRMWALMGAIQSRVNQLIANGANEKPPPPPPPPEGEEDMPLDDADIRKIWYTENLRELVDVDESGVRELRSPAAIMLETQKMVFLAAEPNIDALAAAIVAKLPTGTTNGTEIITAVKQGVREVLREGVGDSPNP